MNNIWQCGGRILDLGRHTLIMGILNVTPDSFSDAGQYNSVERAVERALQMESEGADIIDIGGESTRPGAHRVSEDEEIERVVPIVRALQGRLSIPVSVDTYKAKVAGRALQSGAIIINDISGMTFDREMRRIAAEYNAGVVLMHIKGTPRDMQAAPQYGDVIGEISGFLKGVKESVIKAGVHEKAIVLDPGIGFGKTVAHNFEIIKRLAEFQKLGSPVMLGPSRKSFIGKTLDLPVNQRIEGTCAAVTASILNGAQIIRAHDVKEVKRAATIADAIAGKIDI